MHVKDLWVNLDEFHLREIELDVAPGEYFVILGPTGAGKTVLLETIAGLHQSQKGRILLDGEDITGVPPERRGIGFVYQDYALFPHMTVAANIAFGLTLRGWQRKTIDRRVAEMGELLGIGHLLHRKPDTLSGGEKQRVALGRALLVEPRLLLLDEPLSALDPAMREGLQRELARVHRELGTTTIHVTHDFEEAVALGDRIAVVHEGRVVQVGSPEEIFRKPGSEFVARFVGVRNIFRGEVRAGKDGYNVLHLDPSTGSGHRGLEIAVVTDLVGEVHGSLRPEDIVLSKEPLRSSARNSFRGRIADIADRGTIVYVTVRVPFDPSTKLRAGCAQGNSLDFTCIITRTSLEEMELREGTEIYIAFKASAVHVF
ncbi:MAG: ATP-binding cassette domain-containing protein [Chloroflexi bacterium]|nr:ATP-binding cassette domain-containing protein [Chloroflexota bacterium]